MSATSCRPYQRLLEDRHFIQIVIGPRQTGKTTAIRAALNKLPYKFIYASADTESESDNWIYYQWELARRLAAQEQNKVVLVLDEIQKYEGWSELVKKLWDEDTWNGTDIQVVLSGSSVLLLRQGTADSLLGRFELIHSTHWSLAEMSAAFGYTLQDYLRLGGLPGIGTLKDDWDRCSAYIKESVIEPTISKDILALNTVKKPALLRALAEQGSVYATQEISYRKILGQFDDKGNTDTIKFYLDLLGYAGIMTGIQKFSGNAVRLKSSSPKILLYDTSFMTVQSFNPDRLFLDPAEYGRLVETAVGAYLIAESTRQHFRITWWREKNEEVDFVITKGEKITAIEVKSGHIKKTGFPSFCQKYPEASPLLVGSDHTSVEAFLRGDIPLFV